MAAEQNGAHIRPAPPGRYTSPQSYPSPQMQPSYAYPPPQGQHGDSYRQSPATSNASLPPVTLPPLRSIDGQQPPAHSQLMPQGGQPMPQGMPPMHGYYAHPPPGMPHPQSISPYARYAPIPQGTAMSGSRGKKEIKRRTKTGCLTCRKRRIKCDEQHPVCRNCQKSKRECLGYDPIFKQQSGPQALQPAPGGNNTNTTSASPTPSSATSGAGPYSPRQQSYPAQGGSYPPFPNNSSDPSSATQPPYETNAAIDPALASSPKIDRRSSNQDNTLAPLLRDMEGARMKPVKQLNVNELFQVGQYGSYDIPGHETLDQASLAEIQNYYRRDLAPGLDRLLETTWFSTSGLAKLLATRSLCVEVAGLLRRFAQLGGQNFDDAEYQCRATEARIIWGLLNLCTPDGFQSLETAPTEVDLDLPHGRLYILECLLTNRVFNEHTLKVPLWDKSWSREKTEDLMFWSALAKFTARRSDDQAAAVEKDKYLMQCRNMLSGREHRDVIYSIMVTKHLGWRVPGFPNNMHPEQGGEGSYVNKVYIAHKFVADEAGYRGTNHPIQRICDMAMRSLVIGC